MTSVLEQLKQFTTVVSDSGDFECKLTPFSLSSLPLNKTKLPKMTLT